MQTTPKDAHKDAALSAVSIMHRNQRFIADKIFPMVRVTKQSDYYYKFLRGAWFRNEAKVRAPGGRAAVGGYPLTSSLYKCQEYAFQHPVPIELINNSDAALKPFESGTRFATNKVMLAKEVLASSLVTTTANWASGSSEDAAGGWAYDATTNTFIPDVEAARETVRKLIGVYPNKMVISANTMAHLKQNPSVLDRIKYTGTSGNPAAVTASALAALFELDEVLIGSAIYSDAEEVVAGTDFNAVNLWETNATKGGALLYYSPPAAALEEPATGYCFNWAGSESEEMDLLAVAGNDNPMRVVDYWWDKDTKSFQVRACEYFDLELTSNISGYYFYDTIVT